ncbi:hypothetical protein LJC21_04640, partial [Bacteroides sp. OttesenSCG-928-E20]|nr:hypothetical protein [Bacteroides sp. OttesenSCG-928-E20]
ANGEKAWGISLEFKYPDGVGAVDLTLLKEDLTELTAFNNVTFTIGGTPKTFTKAQTVGGIVLPKDEVISKIEVDTDNDTNAYEYEADLSSLPDAAKTVVAGKRHALTVVVKVVTP